MSVSMEIIDDAVHRIVGEAHPLRVVLFGSVARGVTGPDSDLDLLVVMSDGMDRLETVYRLHRSLRGLGCAADIVVVSESEIVALKDNVSLVIHTALAEGREVYYAV